MTNEANGGRREAAKQARKQALLGVARAILSESDLSMRQLAERAGVAQATPYNLFGSKRDLIAALYVDQRERVEARLAGSAMDPMARLFAAIALVAEDLQQQPHFHRALYRAVYRGEREASERPDERDPGVDFWQAQIDDARAAGCFTEGARTDLYARCVVNLVTGAMLDWSEGRIDAAAWGKTVRYGVALLSMPIAVDPVRTRLMEMIIGDGPADASE